MSRRIAVLGLGYVGLPLAEGFARAHGGAIGFDSDAEHVARLRAGAGSSGVDFTADPARLAGADFFVVAVPTPIDADRRPDLGPLRSAAERIGAALRPGGVVVFESTVYPGVTEDECAPILERRSGLVRGRGFGLGYSPERINPGDAEHTLEDVVKVVAALDEDSWRAIEAVYAPVARAGLYRAPSIRIAEAAKVLENTQRDLNIALMNELAMVCERLGLDTRAVLETAGTKWNFLPFEPGLVGGHCVGVDPYWLTAAAEAAGHHPEVILAGRRINDGMGRWVGARVLEQLALGEPVDGTPRVLVLGAAFKEDVADLRNSRVPELVATLEAAGAQVSVHDAAVPAAALQAAFGARTVQTAEAAAYHAVVLAVRHRAYRELDAAELLRPLRSGGVVIDLKGMVDPVALPAGARLWRL